MKGEGELGSEKATQAGNFPHGLLAGISIVEVVLAIALFVGCFVPILKLFAEGGLSQQRMIRDYPVALNLAERIVNGIENEIEEGRFDPAVFQSPDPEGVDVTEMVLGSQVVQQAIVNITGQDPKAAARFMPTFQVKLSTRPWTVDTNLIEIRLLFRWSDKQETRTSGLRHEIELSLLKNTF